jgi:hypothetical protein
LASLFLPLLYCFPHSVVAFEDKTLRPIYLQLFLGLDSFHCRSAGHKALANTRKGIYI